MRISVVVLTYNSASYIMRCLNSVFRQHYDNLSEVIVVDNGSTDSTAALIEESGLRVKLIKNRKNCGASFARNQAITEASGDWILTLDSDSELRDGFFSRFETCLKILPKEQKVGIISARILNADGVTVFSEGIVLTYLRRFYNRGTGAKYTGDVLRQKEVFGACSATAFYNAEMLKQIEEHYGFYFDRELFIMGEDVDLAWRARKIGWKAYVCPECVSLHTGDGSGLGYRKKKFYSIRNRFIMMKKNDSSFYLLLMFVPLVLFEIGRFIKLLILKEGGLYISACLDFVGVKKTQDRSLSNIPLERKH